MKEMLVDNLMPHPLSQQLFKDLDDISFDGLKEDIRKRGIQHTIEVDLKGRVICGSQRLRAIRELGWKTVEVSERTELETEEEIEEHLIRDNTERRHLSAMERYRAAKHLEQLYANEIKEKIDSGEILKGWAAKKEADSQSSTEQSEDEQEGMSARDRAANEMGMSGATMHRLKKIAESDREDIKNAVEKGQLSVSAAHEALRHKAPSNGEHTEQLKFFQFKREIEKFERYLFSSPRSNFTTYGKDIDKLLIKTQTHISDWVNNETNKG